MSAQRLPQNNPIDIAECDVVCTEESNTFVRHVGLSKRDQQGCYNSNLDLVHMCPPLKTGQSHSHLLGHVDLPDEQRHKIQIFVEDYKEEIKNVSPQDQYIIYPHATSKSADSPKRRFSCAGFVLEAYRWAGLDLINNNSIPQKNISDLIFHYPEFDGTGRLQEKLGLTGNGPWQVVLPGYVLNSLNRTDNEIKTAPFCPEKEHAFFE